MREVLNHYVEFEGDFSMEASEYWIPGDDIVELLAESLPSYGVDVHEHEMGDTEHCLVVQFGEVLVELWIGLNEDYRWFIRPIPHQVISRGFRRKEDYRRILFAIDEILQRSLEVDDVYWYPYHSSSHHLSLIRPSTGPVRDPRLDQDRPLLIRLTVICRYLLSFGMAIGAVLLIIAFAIGLRNGMPLVIGYICFIALTGVVLPNILDRMIYNRATRLD